MFTEQPGSSTCVNLLKHVCGLVLGGRQLVPTRKKASCEGLLPQLIDLFVVYWTLNGIEITFGLVVGHLELVGGQWNPFKNGRQEDAQNWGGREYLFISHLCSQDPTSLWSEPYRSMVLTLQVYGPDPTGLWSWPYRSRVKTICLCWWRWFQTFNHLMLKTKKWNTHIHSAHT